MTDQRPPEDPTRVATPEPSTKSQVDIANDVQEGLGNANDERKRRETTVGGKATQFDGNPNPETDDEGGVFSPPDDTPAVLPKKEGG
ncbi:hypothetical protein ACL598_03060 [Bordetella bronchialis]|uniref:Uncharacterized protein n=1 Tax=Bordetella bronchialis TaxID=463025 RepID=A0A193FTE9_9BORD|nr:hypothetical protein [Bordetella bronchialis]ANN70603.1 hypothetical protein BAU08_03995 [Bordetella bronchialis]